MKKFLKNALLIMLVSCFILNIVNLIWQHVEHYTITNEIIKLAEQVKEKTIKGNEGYQLLATVYSAGFGNKIAIQTGIIGFSIFLGIILGMIFTFEEKSKIRVIIIYLLGLLLTSIAATIYDGIYYMNFNNFFEDVLYYLDIIWRWYSLVFFIIYTVKIYINNRKTKELNKILNKKQKQINIEE